MNLTRVVYLAELTAEVAFDFKDKSANAFIRIVGFVGEYLFGIGIHAAGGLARADGSKDGNSGEEAAFRNNEPAWIAARLRFLLLVNFAEHKKERLPARSFGIRR